MNEDYNSLKELDRVFLEKIQTQTGCAAKWFQSTLHLQNGLTQSCYNTPQHPINLEQVYATPMALHNTLEKARQREEMKNNKRPKGCEYCWRIEDQKSDTLSDRQQWNAYLGKDTDASQISYRPAGYMFTPKVLEVSFSNLCNFKCGYCHPKNSSKYFSEIVTHGKYKDVSHDCDIHFLKIYEEDNNPYLNAFWKWWPDLSKELKTIRLTGGEPLIQKSTQILFEKIKEDPRPNLDLSINSNLGLPHDLFKQRCESLKYLVEYNRLRKVHLYTSMDTWGPQAEYIRHGLNLDVFDKNANYFLEHFPKQDLSFMVTFNIFSLPNFKELLKYWLALKKRHNVGSENRIRIYLNILTEPILYSYLLLPEETATPLFNDAIEFARSHFDESNQFGFNDLVISDLLKVKNDYDKNKFDDPEKLKRYRNEFLNYFTQHDERRKTDFNKTFPEFVTFFDLCKNS